MESAFEAYTKEIGKIPTLTKNEEKEYFERLKGGDESVRNRIAEGNLRLVLKLAHDFTDWGIPLEDAVSAGNVGLIKAIDKYDLSKGAKFSSYASWWIKQAIRSACEKLHQVNMPKQVACKHRAIKKLKAEMSANGFSEAEIEKAVQDTFGRHTNILKEMEQGVSETSLNDLVHDDEESEKSIFFADYTAVPSVDTEKNEMLSLMYNALDGDALDEREKKIIHARFFENKTLDEVSDELHCSKERVRQVQEEALMKLRETMNVAM